ncbi:hypothetical protein SEVIR_2G045300v4 [Setaria viridis]|uniref:Alpha/beta hydrolase fold-3 domain-containing protein n=1 Tax=Setaria viridis TaxID=4556 RepID=A0A4U6VZQ9_SETVI|nr:probable carboxylesterase 15 [Setaria viridis]TKW30547.1 hypothetical protein SEVIR_2G045300v2 [Setaria viridis]
MEGDAPPRVVEDCRGALRVLSDGTVVRSTPPIAGDTEGVRADPSVEWKDTVYDAAHGLGLRIYMPAAAAAAGGRDTKLPVVVYFHGGGFCIGSYAWPIFHAACSRLAAGLSAVLVSADYRLAPEHRLPAAIDDAAAVLLWLRDSIAAGADPWLAAHADAGRVLVAGESAGGVLAHHMNVRFSSGAPLHPVRLRGFVPLMPFFTGGGEPTPSELACPDGAFLNRDMSGRYVRLSLPAGATADHPFLNPFSPDAAPGLDRVDVGPTLVVVAGDDMLRDRNVEYVRRMEEMGKPVEAVVFPGQGHAFFSLRPWSEPVEEMIRVVKRFMDKVCSG